MSENDDPLTSPEQASAPASDGEWQHADPFEADADIDRLGYRDIDEQEAYDERISQRDGDTP